MRRRHDLQAIAACWHLGWSQAREQRLVLAGQSVLYVIVLAIFWGLWSATPLQELRDTAPSREALLWYLAITEWIVFTAGARYREIEREVTSGAIESALLRPVPHGVATLARWAGGCSYQMGVMAVVGVAGAWAMTGSGPPQAALAPLVVLSSALSIALILLCQLQLGYAAVWFGSSAPLFWVWQKLLFVFGGLLFPLLLYPAALRRAAESSPFAAMLSAPAALMFGSDPMGLAVMLMGQLFWLAVLGVLTVAVGQWATSRLLRVGG